MVYIRKKIVKGKRYYYLVEGKIGDNGKVQQKVLMYLGNAKNILEVFKKCKKII